MTLRDHFAGEAMKALIPIFDTDPTFSDSNERRMNVALAAYAQAEEMMKARDL